MALAGGIAAVHSASAPSWLQQLLLDHPKLSLSAVHAVAGIYDNRMKHKHSRDTYITNIHTHLIWRSIAVIVVASRIQQLLAHPRLALLLK